MNYKVYPITSLVLGGLLLLFSIRCESKPVAVELGDNGNNLAAWNTGEISADTFQDSISVATSERLYAGRIDEDHRSYVLLRLNPSTFSQSEICSTPVDSIQIKTTHLQLKTYSTLPKFPRTEDPFDQWTAGADEDGELGGEHSTPAPDELPTLKAYWLDLSEAGFDWNEETVFSFVDDSTLTLGNLQLNLNTPDAEELKLHTQHHGISIYFEPFSATSDGGLDPASVIEAFCTASESDYAVLLTETDPAGLVEIYSSNYLYTSNVPALDIEYDTYQAVDSTLTKYDVLGISSPLESVYTRISGEGTLLPGTVLMFGDSLNTIVQEGALTPVIGESLLDSEIVICNISLQLADNAVDTTHSIDFYFQNVHLANTDLDPAGDDFDGSDTTLTENNLSFDNGELFADCGTDNICNVDEPGYLPDGTEGNGSWDAGELFEDTGIDSLWSSEEEGYDPDTNPDPAGDDYNVDPAQDNWRDCGADGLCEGDETYPGADDGEGDGEWNPGEGTESNGRFDLVSEIESEIFQDTGTDGLFDTEEPGYDPDTNPDPENDNWSPENSNGTEGDGVWEAGEPFLDAGLDGLWSWEEAGYNPDGTENNGAYDSGEMFEDCGSDALCNEEPDTDNYNPDPNGDDYDATAETGTEGNNTLDWTDTDEDGRWDDGEGEQWWDWGTDQVPDSLEIYYGSNNITTSLGSNIVEWDYETDPVVTFELPSNSENYDAALWISRLQLDNGFIELTISAKSAKVVDGIQFTLNHLPFAYQDTVFVGNHPKLIAVNSEKLIDDASLYQGHQYAAEDLNNIFMINYADRLKTVLELNELNAFIAAHENALISRAELKLFVDQESSSIKDNIRLYVKRFTEPVDFSDPGFVSDSLSVASVLTTSAYLNIPADADSVVIDLRALLQDFVVGTFQYNGLEFETDGWDDNFSRLIFNTQDAADLNRRPKLQILYSE
ncbi:MAG: hypothetical protein GXO91_10840 [FCB group bacterium]|nr:hypothetical protein [FCB group bacterium]